jgi:hypothetical protein
VFTWDNVKNPGETKVYAFDWSRELAAGETITSASASLISGSEAGLTIVQSSQFEGALSYVKVSGGTAGLTAAIRGEVVTSLGTYSEVGLLPVVADFDPAQSTLTDLRADLVALRQARVTALTGGQIKEVWRDGRRIAYNVASVADLNKAIHDYENLVTAAEATAAGSNRGRYRALRPRFC